MTTGVNGYEGLEVCRLRRWLGSLVKLLFAIYRKVQKIKGKKRGCQSSSFIRGS
jgi:hypothetical protein